ncbi:MAG: EFR1 family ferrodoxin [Eubacteriales bacterium]|nr:EFR1 family ferrodoxin [Eubacteriales bacterium]
MIFYFSGTGNSKYVAHCMRDEHKIDISDAMKKQEYVYEVLEGESVGFVMPVYYSGIPKTVLEFIRKLSLNGHIEYLYNIFTHGGGPGGAGTMLKKELEKKGYPLHACFDIEMTSNYIMFSDLRPDERVFAEIKASKSLIEKVKTQVDRKEHMLPKWTFIDGILTSSMKFLCDKYMSVKKFHADEGCTGCGMCAKNCPSSLIKMVDGKPQWMEDKCVRCMACIKCPHVQFNNQSSKRRRYSFEKYDK